VDFDLFNTETQRIIKNSCASLSTWPCSASKCEYGLMIRPNTTVCFLNEFETWAQDSKEVRVSELVGNEAHRKTYMEYLREFRTTEYPLGDASKSYDEIIGFTEDRDQNIGPSYVQITGTLTMPLLSKSSLCEEYRRYAVSLLYTKLTFPLRFLQQHRSRRREISRSGPRRSSRTSKKRRAPHTSSSGLLIGFGPGPSRELST
jgi:hypothetical protein